MSSEFLSRRSLFGRLVGAAGLLVGGRLAAAGSIAEPGDAVPLEHVMYYTFDDCGRLISVGECWAPCDASRATQPSSPFTSWTYDDAVGWQYGTG